MTNKEFLDNYEFVFTNTEFGERIRLKLNFAYCFKIENTDDLLLDAGGPQGARGCTVKVGEGDRFRCKQHDGSYKDFGKLEIDLNAKPISKNDN